MLTRVEVQSENPFYMNIRDARPSDSIIVAKIEGLGPSDVDLHMGDYARDGGYYSGRRVPPRTVIFTILLNPNFDAGESASSLRRMLYKSFMSPSEDDDEVVIVLKFDDQPDQLIQAYAEKFDPDIFSDDTAVQITMRCPNPFIRDRVSTVLAASGSTVPFVYKGTAGTGIQTTLKVISSTEQLRLDLNGRIFGIAYPFQVEDRVKITTIRGFRRVQLLRSGSTTDILYAKMSGSTWLTVFSEQNVVKIYGATSSDVAAEFEDFRYLAQHWGI